MVIWCHSYFLRYGTWRTDGQSRDNPNFCARWVTKFSKVWGSAEAPSVRRSSAIIDKGHTQLINQYTTDYHVHR